MAATPSAMIPLGRQMPFFSLPDTTGTMWSPKPKTQGTLVVFMCNHCPFVIHVANILPNVASQCLAGGIEMFGINSNDIVAFPEDRPVQMAHIATKYNWAFPYVIDETQNVATQFGAVSTPDVFLYDQEGKLYYRGQFDDSRPNSDEISDGRDLLHAMDEMLKGNPPPSDQKPAIGCNIKWKQ